MNNQVKSLEQLKDSRILYDKKIPDLGYILLLVVVFLLIAVTAWSIQTPKIDVIKSSGTIHSVNKNYVMSPYMGKIANIKLKEGMNVETGEVLLNIKSTDFELQGEQLEGKKILYEERISQLNKLVNSIKNNTNYFNEEDEKDALYYYQFEDYKSKIAQQKVDVSTYKNYGYSDEQIESEMEKNQSKVAEVYYSTLRGIEDNIIQYRNELANINIQDNALGIGLEEYQITANVSGKVHMLADYKEGMVVQAGTAIANISSEQDEYIIQAFIGSESRARVELGDKVDIAVAGLPQTVYGTISGTVTSIDADITVNNENNTSYFKVNIIPDNSYIISKNGYNHC